VRVVTPLAVAVFSSSRETLSFSQSLRASPRSARPARKPVKKASWSARVFRTTGPADDTRVVASL
jgi:hypothetical protein